MKKRLKNTLLSLIFIALGIFLSTIYRPYIYLNNLQDFGLADIGNNIVFIPCVYFLVVALKGNYLLGKYKDIMFHLIMLSIFELLSSFIKGIGTFDLMDIFGLSLGALLTYIISKHAL